MVLNKVVIDTDPVSACLTLAGQSEALSDLTRVAMISLLYCLLLHRVQKI